MRPTDTTADTRNVCLADPVAGGEFPLGACRPPDLLGDLEGQLAMQPLVLSPRDRLKVIGIHARRVWAEVMEKQGSQRHSSDFLVGRSMRESLTGAGVSVHVDVPRPEPAGCVVTSVSHVVTGVKATVGVATNVVLMLASRPSVAESSGDAGDTPAPTSAFASRILHGVASFFVVDRWPLGGRRVGSAMAPFYARGVIA